MMDQISVALLQLCCYYLSDLPRTRSYSADDAR